MLDSQKRSRLFWVSVVVALCALVGLETLLVEWVIYPLWMVWNPGRTVGYWLLGTPVKSIAGHVRAFFLYIPELSLGFMTGMGISLLFRRCWLSVTFVFAVAFTLIDRVRLLAVWFAYFGDVAHLPLSFLFIESLTLFASPIAGAYLTARFLVPRPIDPERCRKCGYLLKGLAANRCPECGTEFDAAPLKGPAGKQPEANDGR